MSSPRKFSDKIALLQQKQAEGDVAFRTILCEVGEAKQRANPLPTGNFKLDVPKNNYEKPYEKYQGSAISPNCSTNSDINHRSSYLPTNTKIENNNDSDQLLQPPENTSWRRTNSDPSLHHPFMGLGINHYQSQPTSTLNNAHMTNYEMNSFKSETQTQINNNTHHLQVGNLSFQSHPFDYNQNQNYVNEQSHPIYPHAPITATISLPNSSQTPTSNPHNHPMLGPRHSGGSVGSNVLMLPPPNQHTRGGSLPDLRTGNVFHSPHVSFSTTPSPPMTTNPQFFRSSSTKESDETDLYMINRQQQMTSHIGPLKASPSIRRRPSPIGEIRQISPRRHNSPSPDISPKSTAMYRVEPSSPQSQSSYSPQNSPHLLSSPGNDHGPFSPQQSVDNNGNTQQIYYGLSAHLDQISLDHNTFFPPQQISSSTSSLQQQTSHHHQCHHPSPSSSRLSSLTNENDGVQVNFFRPNSFYPLFMDNMSMSYGQTQSSTITNNVNQKSPTIPNIILTDADSSKLDLSKDLTNDFTHSFDVLIDSADIQLNTDDFLLNGTDLSIDPHLCVDPFRMEN